MAEDVVRPSKREIGPVEEWATEQLEKTYKTGKKAVEYVAGFYARLKSTPEKIALAIRDNLPQDEAEALNRRFDEEIQSAQKKQDTWTLVGAGGGLIAGAEAFLITAYTSLKATGYDSDAVPLIKSASIVAGLGTWVGSMTVGYTADMAIGKMKAAKDIKEFVRSELDIDLDKQKDVWEV